MTDFDIIDFREEFYLKVFRRWLVIARMCENSKFRAGAPLQKAAFVDFLLCNPRVMQRLLVKFGRAEPTLNLEDLLYRDNIEYGSVQDERDFAKTCVLLIRRNYAEFSKVDGVVSLFPAKQNVVVDNYLSKRWYAEIDALQPLLGKSINVLHSSVLEEEKWN